MYHVDLNESGKLLTIQFSGHVDAEEAKACFEKVETLKVGIKPGFHLLTDLSRLERMDAGCAAHLRKVMALCNASGVEKVVRVIPDPKKDIGFQILSIFHYGRHVRIVTCDTLAEAQKILSSSAELQRRRV